MVVELEESKRFVEDALKRNSASKATTNQSLALAPTGSWRLILGTD